MKKNASALTIVNYKMSYGLFYYNNWYKIKSMRKLFYLSILFFCVFNCKSQSSELSAMGKDTINKIDKQNQKQGKWIIRSRDKRETCFSPQQISESGQYINNRKNGLWIEYYCDSKIRNKLTYVNGVLEGYAVFYNTDEKILKEGYFKNNKWISENVK